MIQRLNPGPGLADFWTEFKRPNPYRWPILAGSALLTCGLLYLLADRDGDADWLAIGVVALVAAVAIGAMIAEHVRIHFGVLLVAVALTGTIIYQFVGERWRVPIAKPDVTYITTFDPDRTDEEIRASNVANQKVQDARRAEQRRREDEAKEAYRALGRASGIDVDAMEREIAREKTGAPVADRQR